MACHALTAAVRRRGIERFTEMAVFFEHEESLAVSASPQAECPGKEINVLA